MPGNYRWIQKLGEGYARKLYTPVVYAVNVKVSGKHKPQSGSDDRADNSQEKCFKKKTTQPKSNNTPKI